MKKVIYSQVLAESPLIQGKKITFYIQIYANDDWLPVNVELEVNEDGVVMTITHKELTDEEKMRICDRTEGCGVCPISELCSEETES